MNAFTSKYDLTKGGKVKLTKEEQKGLALFQGKAGCKACHPATGQQALFTDFTFDNLGVPQNPENPAGVAPNFVDPGLGGFLKNAGYDEDVYEAEWGKHKVPTLRNVDLRPDAAFVKAYGHNGYFKSLEGIVHFYNTRDVLDECPGVSPYTEAQALAANCWPAPEIADNVNTDELGDLGLTADEETAIVAFLKTLSDGWLPPIPGAITVEQFADPVVGTKFPFVLEYPDTTTATFSLSDGDTWTMDGLLDFGNYSLEQSIPTGWQIDGIECYDTFYEEDPTTIAGNPLGLDVREASDIVCTFTNSSMP